MLTAIAILLGLHFIVDVLDDGDVNLFSTPAFIIVLWNTCFPLAIIVMVITAIIILIHLFNK